MIGYTNRFSEDLDFLMVANRDLNRLSNSEIRKLRSNNKNTIFKKIDSLESFEIIDLTASDENRFFNYEIKYPLSQESKILRPFIKLEYTADNILLYYEKKPIQSIVSKIMNTDPELEIDCVSPVEIAGNKISALAWRILTNSSDETIIRHLYDLVILKDLIMENPDNFKKVAISSIKKDKASRAKSYLADMAVNEILYGLLEKLNSSKYNKDYDDFALSMSYDEYENKISFKTALEYISEICEVI